MNSSSPKRTPHFVLFIATACGFGYIPLAPGTFGSLAGVALALSVYQFLAAHSLSDFQIIIIRGTHVDPLLVIQCQITFVVALAGLWSADSASRHWQQKVLNAWSSTRYPGSTSHFCWARHYRYGGGRQIPGRRRGSASSPTSRRLAGNICCWVLFFSRVFDS